MAVHLRYCPACREEYQPHMLRCIECGTALKDLLEDESPEYDQPKPEEPLLPPGEYRPIAGDVDSGTAAHVMKLFRAAAIPLKVEAHGYSMRLSARSEDVPAALGILEQEGVLPKRPVGADKDVASEGGPCPACGAAIQPDTPECPDCGLQLIAEAEPCEKCGSPLAATDAACLACGQPRD